MRTCRLAISGLGNVGRRLLELIERKRDMLQTRYELELILTGVCDSSGAICDIHGIDAARIISAKEQTLGIATLSGSNSGMDPGRFVASVQADIFVELTLTNLKNGEPGLSSIRSAFERQMHVVTANKGPLVLAYSQLSQTAKSNDLMLLHSATVTGGLPTLNIGRRDLLAAGINKFEGVVNGTTNYILTRMTAGESYISALQHAQEVGMAEADPTLDVDGWDAACKLVIIANAVLGRATTMKDVSVEGIRGITPGQLQQALARKQVIKLIALAEKKLNDYELSVRPIALDHAHPLARIGADTMAVVYHTDINGTIFASIEEEDPYPTAAAVLRDIVTIATA